MGSRRKAREMALQVLFQTESSSLSFQEALDLYWRLEPKDEFTENLTLGVGQHLGDIDALIQRHATHWKLPRMASVDRNVLRLATYELMHEKDTPASVIINEAIEIGRRFGTSESGAFINGILDQIAKELRGEA